MNVLNEIGEQRVALEQAVRKSYEVRDRVIKEQSRLRKEVEECKIVIKRTIDEITKLSDPNYNPLFRDSDVPGEMLPPEKTKGENTRRRKR